jgi:mono/diheme cytochrome c family protein
VSWDQASTLQSPVSSSAQTREQARKLYDVNCSACHGKTANGQSEVASRFSAAGAIPPPDFRSPRVTGRTDGQLYWLVTNGIGNMPPFGDLLTDEQRWMVVQFIRNPQVQ